MAGKATGVGLDVSWVLGHYHDGIDVVGLT